jgi:hypothetical protein
LVPVSTSFLKSFRESVGKVDVRDLVLARGVVFLDHMDRGRLGKYRGMTVELTLNLTVAPSDLRQHQNVCINVAGPRVLLDDLNEGHAPGGCSSVEVGTAVSFATHSKEHLPANWCSNKTSMELTYEQQPDWVNYVSAGDRNLIHLHLLCTSAFLFVLAASVLLVILFNGLKQQRGSSAVKSVGEGRGDGGHFLLPQASFER